MAWQRTDDLDGSTPADQVTFGLDGRNYTIDLSNSGHEALKKALAPFLAVAVDYASMVAPPEPDVAETPTPVRRTPHNKETSKTTKPKPAKSTATKRRKPPAMSLVQDPEATMNGGANGSASIGKTKLDTGLVRQWARDNGYDVQDRGRVPVQVVDAYLEAAQYAQH